MDEEKKYSGLSVDELKKLLLEKDKTLTSQNDEIYELRHAQIFFKTLMDQIPDTIYFKDNNSKFTLINKAQVELLGLKSAEDAIGKSDFDFFLDKHASAAYNAEQEIIKSKKVLIAKEEKIRDSKGKFKWVTDTKVPILDENNVVVGTAGITRDITQFKEAEEKILEHAKELQYLNASKDKFFSIIAHDLKNPFYSLLGSTEILIVEKDQLTEMEKEALINTISSSCKHTYHLLNNLLQWSRAQTGRIEYCPTIFDFDVAVNESFALLENLASKKKVILKKELPANLIVYADANMIETVLRNLVTNAIKFSESNKEIIVSAEENTNGKIQINVSDSGVGISQQDILKLFRIDVNHTTPGTCHETGSGLGLILCKEFVEKNGGKIWVTSEKGVGSTFSFLLPKNPEKNE